MGFKCQILEMHIKGVSETAQSHGIFELRFSIHSKRRVSWVAHQCGSSSEAGTMRRLSVPSKEVSKRPLADVLGLKTGMA